MAAGNPITAFLAVGSNLGDRKANITLATDKLRETSEIEVVRISRLLENPAVGMESNAPAFLNGAIEVRTTLGSRPLLHRLLEIERGMGRQRRQKWEPRVIDLDLLLFGSEIVSSQDLVIPHPLMHERRFVLEPLAEIAPAAVHPKLKMTFAELLKNLPSPQKPETTRRG